MHEKEHAAGGKPAAAAVSNSLGGSAHPQNTTFAPGVQALWQNRDHDQPVTIRAYAGEQDGQHWWWIEGSSTALPAAELRPMPAPSSNGAGDDLRQVEIEATLAQITALLEQARVEPPAVQPAEPDSDALTAFLLSAGTSDEANAQCVNRLYAGRFLYAEALGWLYWRGTHWTTEGAEAALDRAVVATLLKRIEAASQPDTFESYGALRKSCVPNRGKLEGAKCLLSSLVHVEPAVFDAEPDLLNCKNGVLNLRTGELIPHDPSQRFMHCTAVAYKPGADPSQWTAFLAEVVGGGPDMVRYLQTAIGYSLTGHTREEVLFYLFGPSRSGKGTFTETLLALLTSPLGKEISFGTFTAQRTGDSQNFDLAPLKPCRLVAASESNTYERFNEAKVKAITGGNEIYCAHKHKPHFNYRPQFKLWLSSNQPVNADPDDDAVWARVRLIEFPRSLLGHEDKLLKARMKSRPVLEGVLAWAVQGAQAWYALGAAGLSEPPRSQTLKDQQRDTLDAIGMWVEECCEQGEHYFTAGSALYQSYEGWCKENGVEPKKQKGLATGLQRKGHRADRSWQGGKVVRGFYGLKLRATH